MTSKYTYLKKKKTATNAGVKNIRNIQDIFQSDQTNRSNAGRETNSSVSSAKRSKRRKASKRSRPGGWNTGWSRWFTKLIDLCFFLGRGISNQQIPTKCQGISETLRWDECILEGNVPQDSTPSSNCTLASFRAMSLSVVEEGMNDETS